MKDETILAIVAIICLTAIEIVNHLTLGHNAILHTSIASVVVFIATKQYYKPK